MITPLGVGQRAGAVEDFLQYRVQVEALIHAAAGLAQLGEAVAQRLYLVVTRVCFFQLIISIGRWETRAHERRRASTNGLEDTYENRGAALSGPGSGSL